MALGISASKHMLRTLLVVLLAGFSLAGCDTLNSLTGKSSDDAKEPEYVERPVDQIYGDAWKKINQGDWVGAAKQFDEVERQHPLFDLGAPRDADVGLLLLPGQSL